MYFIAQVLPPHLNEQVLQWKWLMQERYGCKVALKSPAHITLVPPFWLDEQFEAALVQDTNTVVAGVAAFTIITNGFSAFKPRTIFIAVEPNAHLDALKKKVDDFFAGKEAYKVKLDRRPFHPHITIATRDLHKKTFAEAWPLFETKAFKEEWTADSISVLRHNKKNWEVFHMATFIS